MLQKLDLLPSSATWLQMLALAGLVVMALYVLIVGIVKGVRAREMRSSSLEMLQFLTDELGHNRIDLAIATCHRYSESHLAHAIMAGLNELKDCRTLKIPDTLLAARVREAMDRGLAVQVVKYKEHFGLVDAVGRTAPFVGVVIGTAGGVAAGTVIALVTIWAAVFLRSHADRIETELKSATSEIRQFLALHGVCMTCGKESRYLHYGTFSCAHCCDKCSAGVVG